MRSVLAAACLLTRVAVWPQQPPLSPGGENLPAIEGRAVNLVAGDPVRRATLTLRPIAQQGSPRIVISDAAGRFSFERVQPGTYSLSAERTGFLRQDYGGRPSSVIGTPLSVSDSQPLTGLVFKLTPQGIISGKVLDEEGEAAPNTNVILLRQTGFGSSRRLK